MTCSIAPFLQLSARCIAALAPLMLVVQPSLASEALVLDQSLVARRSATIQGALEGNLTVLDASSAVTVERGATISGNLVLPAEKVLPSIARADPSLKPNRSSRVTLDNRGGAESLKGAVSTAAGFKLPRFLAHQKPVKSQSLVVQETTQAPADFSDVGNITVRKPGATVAVPPGNYGDLVVTQGTVVLGTAGASEPVRYDFRSFDIQPAGKIEVAGPVVVTVANGATVRGTVGRTDAPLWLDLRVLQGDVVVGGQGSLNAFLIAPASKVTVSRGGSLSGGAASDRLEIENGASAKVVAPDWSANATEKTRPRFPHKAMRLQARVPQLNADFRHSYYPGTSYIEDKPCLIVAEGKRPREHPMATFEEHRAFFEACCTLFLDTGFERGVLTLIGYSDNPVANPPETRNLTLTHSQFFGSLAAISEKDTPAEGIVALHRNPVLLEKFRSRVLALGLVADSRK